jgi:hypothetical protein
MSEQMQFFAEVHNDAVNQMIAAFYVASSECDHHKAGVCKKSGGQCRYSGCPMINRQEA